MWSPAFCRCAAVEGKALAGRAQVRGIVLEGSPQTESSWFPGYAWTIAYCRACWHHVGWRFTAVQPGLKPSCFWGLRRSAIMVRGAGRAGGARVCGL